jgi:hypothetical protein
MIRCSSIESIMTEPQKKSDEWSKTAQSYMMEIVREELFGVRKNLDDMKAIQKGRMCEDDGIELYNNVFMYNLKKIPSEGRRNNGIITGEPDLVAASSRKGVDIKVAWSLLTFPLNEAMADGKGYEWQARGYMCLFDLPEWEIAYCAIDTPDELLREWDDLKIHKIDSAIPMHHRITIARYTRDMEIENKMLEKCKMANEYVQNAIKTFTIEHDKYIL